MEKSELIDLLRNNEVTITFTKVNGETRVMNCTLKESVIGASFSSSGLKRPSKLSESIVAVWDLEKQDWRSFVFDNLVSAEITNGVAA